MPLSFEECGLEQSSRARRQAAVVAFGVDYFCLAAGKGTRFGELGRYLQKCMYPVGLRPFLELSVHNLVRSSGFDSGRDRLFLVVGQFQEQVRAYFGNNYEGLKICYAEQPQPLGTGHALHLAYEVAKPTESVIAWLADLYVPTPLFEALQQHPFPNVQTLGPGHDDEKPDLQVSVSGDRVTQAWRGAGDYDAGLWKLSPEVFAAHDRAAARRVPDDAELADGLGKRSPHRLRKNRRMAALGRHTALARSERA